MANVLQNLPALMNDAETAAMLGIKPGSLPVWRSTRRYPLPWIKVGRLVRYRRDDVLAFLESRTVRPVSTQAA